MKTEAQRVMELPVKVGFEFKPKVILSAATQAAGSTLALWGTQAGWWPSGSLWRKLLVIDTKI